MIHFRLPDWVKKILDKPLGIEQYPDAEIEELKRKLVRFSVENPIVSVVIPAWNEEEGIIHTLISLANTSTAYPAELIVVDNNSTDGTSSLLKKLGIQTIFEPKQGIGHARTAGLHYAKGKYLLMADSDTLYPPGWISALTKAMIDGEEDKVYCVHGTYSFLPSISTPRWQYGIYEYFSHFAIKKKGKRQPYLNVLGYNSGIVRQKGIEVNGYDIKIQRTFRGIPKENDGHATEDGMMAFRILESGGQIRGVEGEDGRVWTSDRRIQIDGGLLSAFIFRVRKHLFKRHF